MSSLLPAVPSAVRQRPARSARAASRSTTLATSAAALAALTLGCADPTAAPGRMPTGGPSRAVSVNVMQKGSQFEVNDSDGCTGDQIAGTSTFHFVLGETTDGVGGTHEFVKLTNANVKAVGSPSGTEYVGSSRSSSVYNVTPGETRTYTETRQGRYIGRGQATDRSYTIVYHVTVNANGEVTTRVLDFRPQCR